MMKKSLGILVFSAVALAQAGASAGSSPVNIFDAARAGDLDAVAAYLAEGGDTEVSTELGHTPFILATYNGRVEAAKMLLEAGAEACAIDAQGSSASMGVIFKGHTDVLKWLTDVTDCDVDHRNYAGQTALMMASLFDRIEIAEWLLQQGADPSIADHRGNTAESLARGQGLIEMQELLQSHRQLSEGPPSVHSALSVN
ncbi:ankyrin repeat domain-containing protein [Algihabitans albus]|uniref:ankyrin repeat domain-containing protein n=1 Tax=Algihabitans albus TaxID=2164067 RepID=UPI0035D11D05